VRDDPIIRRGRERADDAERRDRHEAVSNRRQPILRPPSKRITISAGIATLTTVSFPTASDGKASDTKAAATSGAATRIENRPLSFVISSARARPAETKRTSAPKEETSFIEAPSATPGSQTFPAFP
jgi:hypothetical protein